MTLRAAFARSTPLVHRSSEPPQRPLSSRMAVIPEISDTPNQGRYEQEHAGTDSSGSSTLSGDRLSLVPPCQCHCGVRKVHGTCKRPRARRGMRRSTPLPGRTYKDSLRTFVPSSTRFPANSRKPGTWSTTELIFFSRASAHTALTSCSRYAHALHDH